MMGLRLNEGVPWPAPEAFGGQRYQLNDHWLDIFAAEGWLEKTAANLSATLQGRLRLNAILTHLLGDDAGQATDPVR